VDGWKGTLEGMVTMPGAREIKHSYNRRRVLVTGNTGFKGGWLSLWLLSMGAEVHGLSLEPPTIPSFFRSTGLGQRMVWTNGDIRDRETIEEAIRKSEPELVFHLAAQPIVRESYLDPVGTFETNVMGTVNVLEAVRHSTGIKGCLCITSDKCYENLENGVPFKESDPIGGSDPYSASKGAAELVITSYRRSFFESTDTIIASARAGNVIGGGDWGKDRLVPDCIRSLQKGEEVVLRSPGAVRPWQHVLDPLSGYLKLGAMMLDSDKAAEGAWNFGPPKRKETTVEELVKIVVEEWGEGSWRAESANDHRKESICLSLDSSKATNELGWTSTWDVRTSVRRSVEWYRKQDRGEDMWSASLDQILTYENDQKALRKAI
jgi:CDP-glucose 4,6-dehydratase